MLDYKFAYLIGDLILLPLWLFLFFHRKDLRKEIVLTSLLFAVVSPISDYVYIHDYWRPETFVTFFHYHGIAEPLIEDLLFGFLIGGISSTVYEELWGRKYSKRSDKRHNWKNFIPPFVGFVFLFLLVTVKIYQFNSMHASAIVFILCALTMLYFRRDLWLDSLASGFLTGLIMFFGYIFFLWLFPLAIQKWWLVGNISGVLISGIPIEEMLWGFGLGMMVGPMYEFFTGLSFKKTKCNI